MQKIINEIKKVKERLMQSIFAQKMSKFNLLFSAIFEDRKRPFIMLK
jgi:hypothetical protein